MKCLDEAPDVLGYVKNMATRAASPDEKVPGERHRRQPLSVESSIRSIKEPIKSLSGHAYSMGDRFVSRPSSAPGPWTYFTLKPPREIRGSKFTSRKEPPQESIPSPGSYFISDKVSSRYGFMPREPKIKAQQADNKIGPGFYDLNESVPKYVGTVFPKDSRDLVIAKGDGVPGPGHYRTQSCDSAKCYSISKSNHPSTASPQKLGPGCYDTETIKQPQGHTFSNSLRFDMPYFDRIETYLVVAKSQNSSSHDKSILRRNLDISEYRPNTKASKLRKKSCQNDVKREITQKTKKAIQEAVIQRRQEAITTKFRRYEIRKHKDEIQQICCSWFKVYAFIGCAYVWKRKGENKMALRSRSDKVLRWLMLFSWTVGKLLLRKKRRKVVKSMNLLKGIARPVNRWLMRRKRKLAGMIVDSLELSLTHNIIFKLMGAWRINLIKIQRELKLCIANRRSTYNNLLIKWNKSEFTIAKKLKSQGMKSEELGAFNIPLEVKKFLIRYKIKETVRRHKMALTVYHLQLTVAQKEMSSALRSQDDQVQAMLGIDYPNKPVLSLNFNSAIMKELILKAQSLRTHWDSIILTLNVSALERELAPILNEETYSTPASPSRSSKTRKTESLEFDGETRKRRTPKSLSRKS